MPPIVRIAAGFLAFSTIGIPLAVLAQERATAPAQEGTTTFVACVVREGDYVRSSSAAAAATSTPQFLLIDASSGSFTHSVTGVREPGLEPYVGRRVEITGVLERARTTPVLTTTDGSRQGSVNSEAPGAAGVTPDGAAAHEPSDALAATVRAGAVSTARDSTGDVSYQIETLTRLNVSAFRTVEGGCASPPSPADRQGVPSAADVGAPQRVPLAPGPVPVKTTVVRGCLERQTSSGTALTPQTDTTDALVMTRASIVAPSPAPDAVPGSATRGTGSTTVPDATTGTAGVAADPGVLSYALNTPEKLRSQLAPYVGERVEVVGVVSGGDAARTGAPSADNAPAEAGARLEPSPDVAHASAPARVISVSSFRAIGGACR